jgi:peptidoglycan/LPS O-acetylase OafA/YrhL
MADHEKPFLNTLRWTSAFLVMAGHALGWTYQVDLTTLAAAKYVLDLGHAAVIIFFVVSGYLVGGGVFARADSFRWGPFASARIARIYAVLVPALVLTVCLDGWAYLTDPHNPIYDAAWGRIPDPVFKSYRPSNIAASLLSLESVIGAPIGSDKPLWSLGFEWVFYFVCPLALIGIRRASANVLIRIGLCAALAVVMFALHQRWMASYWLIWLAGAAASQVQLSRWPAIVLLAVGVAALLASPFIDERLTDPIEGFGLAGFLA